jgi:putative transposase
MCRVLEVAPSGFYAWRKQPTPARRRRDHVLGVHVRAAFAASRRRYGSPRVHAELRAAGHHVGRKRVARLMREDGLVARPQRRFVATTQSRHDSPIAPNLLERRFEVDAPNRVWVADLTYLRCTAGSHTDALTLRATSAAIHRAVHTIRDRRSFRTTATSALVDFER